MLALETARKTLFRIEDQLVVATLRFIQAKKSRAITGSHFVTSVKGDVLSFVHRFILFNNAL
jgi:hypothetical protein